MKRFVWFLGAILASVQAVALHKIQSEFEGPVYLKTWQHKQLSWNVERETAIPYEFRIYRGWDGKHTPTLVLEWKKADAGDTARLVCEGKRPKGEWETEPYRVEFKPADVNLHAHKYFVFEGEGCVDEKGSVTETIKVEVIRGGKAVFDYTVRPMYVRGNELERKYNLVPGYNVHAGAGEIFIATEASDTAPDYWDGTKVEPKIQFTDHNVLKKDAIVGLHRHVANQEIYWVDRGIVKVQSGLAPIAGMPFRNQRLWDAETNEFREVDEVRAAGGWIESRILEPGQRSIIVPNGQRPDVVYFHGLQAMNECAFWTMGARN